MSGGHPFRTDRSGDRETMCKSVEKYAEEYGKECAKRQEISTKLVFIIKLMKEAGFTLDQA